MPRSAAKRWRGSVPSAIAKAWVIGAAINLASPAIIISPPIAQLPRTGFFATKGASMTAKIRQFPVSLRQRRSTPGRCCSALPGVAAIRLIQLAGFATLACDRNTWPILIIPRALVRLYPRRQWPGRLAEISPSDRTRPVRLDRSRLRSAAQTWASGLRVEPGESVRRAVERESALQCAHARAVLDARRSPRAIAGRHADGLRQSPRIAQARPPSRYRPRSAWHPLRRSPPASGRRSCLRPSTLENPSPKAELETTISAAA